MVLEPFIFFFSSPIMSASSSSFQLSFGQRSLVKLKNLYTVKLDRTSYFTWKAQVMMHLQGNGLLRFIEVEAGEDDVLAVQQDQLLFGWIFSTITPSVLLQVTPYMTSFKVWSALTGISNAKSKTRIL